MSPAASNDAIQGAALATMQVLFRAFTNILLRRDGPDVLPASPFLLQFALAAYLAVSFTGLLIDGTLLREFTTSAAAVLFDAGLLSAWIWVMLGVAGHPKRFRQSLTAALGCGAIIGFYTLPVLFILIAGQPVAVDDVAGTNSDPGLQLPVLSRIAVAVYVVMLAWYAAVMGHILAAAMEIHALAGLALGIFYVLASLAIVGALFPLGT
ncbi:MAG: hypothetical protein HKN59_00905 [Gammaproteobacteria bacterium]|nr:hypothetical protein [Gammaproteobacteria bacterium]